MTASITGIHHVTAFAKDPLRNADFYTRVLGMRLVKKTVNFDDPMTYHLYYGDDRGAPGSLLTHFPHPFAKHGVHGSPEILETVLGVRPGAMGLWAERLRRHGVGVHEQGGDEPRIAFSDPDGMRFSIIESDQISSGERRIEVIAGTVIHLPGVDETERFLKDVLGFTDAGSSGSTRRLILGAGGPGQRLELVETPFDRATSMGAGTVHHVAWRVPDDATQALVSRAVIEAGIHVTPVMDRQYFRSIYFRIPGGVIFEVATDGPGFGVDEPLETLGEALKLPPQYESRREEIEGHLVPLSGGDTA